MKKMRMLKSFDHSFPPESTIAPAAPVRSSSSSRCRRKSFITALCLVAGLAVTIQDYELAGSKNSVPKNNESGPKNPITRDLPKVHPIKSKVSRSEYTAIVRSNAGRYRIDPKLIHAIVQIESSGNPKAVSRMGAKGLMQLMPAVCSRYGVRDPFDMGQNIRAGTAYLAYLVRLFKGDLQRALAAYHCGLKQVIENNGVPPGQAQEFVRKIMDRYEGPVVCTIDRTES